MVIVQMLSLYHCTRYHFLNICRNIKHIVFLFLFAENPVISVWVYFGRKCYTWLITSEIYICTVICGHLGLTKSWFQIIQMQVLFFPWQLAVLTCEWMGGQVGRGKYLVWPVSQNLLELPRMLTLDRGIGYGL